VNQLIVIDHANLRVQDASEEARQLVQQCLERLALIPVEIDTEQDQKRAVEAQREAKTLLKSIETARKSAKEPVLELGRQIDKLAETLVADVKDEEMRVARAIGDFQQRILEIARVEVRKRAEAEAELERQKQAELDRVRKEQEALAAEARRKADAEAAKIREEANRLAAAARTAAEAERAKQAAEIAAKEAEIRRLRMEEELARKAQEAQQRVHDLAKQEAEMSLPPVVAPVKAEGQIVREVWCHEVTDMHALYRANPGLVELKPRTREINELLNRGITSIPGLRTWKEVRSSARATATPKAIEV
jgi:colicin import membrane protein